METVTQHQYESRLDSTSEPTAGNSSAWVKQHETGCFSSTAAARGNDAATELGDSLRGGVVASRGIWRLPGELNPQPTDPDAASPGRDPSHPLPRLIYRAQSEARERSVCCPCRDPVLQGLHRVWCSQITEPQISLCYQRGSASTSPPACWGGVVGLLSVVCNRSDKNIHRWRQWTGVCSQVQQKTLLHLMTWCLNPGADVCQWQLLWRTGPVQGRFTTLSDECEATVSFRLNCELCEASNHRTSAQYSPVQSRPLFYLMNKVLKKRETCSETIEAALLSPHQVSVSCLRCVQSNIVLLTQAFRKKFVIPDFQSFSAHIDELYENAKSMSGGQVSDPACAVIKVMNLIIKMCF